MHCERPKSDMDWVSGLDLVWTSSWVLVSGAASLASFILIPLYIVEWLYAVG
jgi:hypothetical protein